MIIYSIMYFVSILYTHNFEISSKRRAVKQTLCHGVLPLLHRLSFTDLTSHASLLSRQRDIDHWAILYNTECNTVHRVIFNLNPPLQMHTYADSNPRLPFVAVIPAYLHFRSPFT